MGKVFAIIASAVVGFITFGWGGAVLFATLTTGSILLQPKLNTTQARDIIIRSATSPKIVVYGETFVGGLLAYMNQRPISGDQNYELWAVLVHAAHEVEEISDFYYESDLLRSGTELSWSANKTDVNSGRWHADDQSHEASTIWRRYGTSTQSMPTELTSAFTELNANFRLRGYACSVHRWTIFDESEELFRGNHPQNVRAKVKGKKIYDMRLDTSPGANPDNQTYFAWTQNPILCCIDYMRSYMNIPAARFDWDYLEDQANRCDVSVSTPDGTENRYLCNGAISLGDSHDDNVGKILAACLGTRTTVNGLVRLVVGDDQAADVTLDESDVIGAVTIKTALSRQTRFNRAVARYYSSNAEYVQTESLPQENATFVSRDNGEEITKQIALDMVTGEYTAQRICYKALQQTDQQISIEVPLRWSGLRLTPGTYVSFSYSKMNWVNKLFRCEVLKISESGVPVTALLREDASTAWDDPAVGEYVTKNAQGIIQFPANPVPPPTSMVANATTGGINVSWVNPRSETIDFVRIYSSPDSSWSNATVRGVSGGNTFFDDLAKGATRYYWVRSVRANVESQREPNSDTSDRTDTVLVADVGWSEIVNDGDKPEDNATSNTFWRGASPYAGPTPVNDHSYWMDTTTNPELLKFYTGSAWVVVSNNVTDTNEILDGAGLGDTANWSEVVNDDGGLPEPNATQNSFWRGPSPYAGPTPINDKSYWMRTDTTPDQLFFYTGSAWVVVANNVTDTNEVNDGAGLGNTANWSQIFNDGGQPEDNATANTFHRGPAPYTGPTPVNNKSYWMRTDTVPDEILFYTLGAWTFVGNAVQNTSEIFDDADLGHTADWSQVADDDNNKPANNATVGAPSDTPVGALPDSDAVSNTIDAERELNASVAADDSGGTYRLISKGLARGDGRDGDAVAFTNDWTDVPAVLIVNNGLVYSSALTGSQFQDMQAQNTTTSGFTLRAKLAELVGTTTLRTDSTRSIPSSPAGLDESINKTQSASAWDNNYTFQLDIFVNNVPSSPPYTPFIPGSVSVGLYTNDGVAGWIRRHTIQKIGFGGGSVSSFLNETHTINVTGLGLNDDFGINVDSFVIGGSVDFDNVKYETANPPQETSATPTGANKVDYFVLGGEE